MLKPAPETGIQRPTWPEPGRLAGVDVARALAVFGMFAVHLGAESIGLLDGTAADTVYELARGRSSALFAFLAGVSLALLSGRGTPLSGLPLQRVRTKVVVRAVLLALIGVFLDFLGTPVAIILVYYAGYFLLALPLLRMGAPALAGFAVAIALLGPQLSYLIRSLSGDPGSPPASITGIGDFFVSGYYPAFTFMAFIVAGMAVGRLNLWSALTRAWLVVAGTGLALVGYGGSRLLMGPLGGVDRLAQTLITQYYGTAATTVPPEELSILRAFTVDEINSLHGNVPTDDPSWLLVASPHSGTTFEIAGAVGTALVTLAVCLLLVDWLRWGLYPLAAVGSMVLTVYAGHIVVMALLGGSSSEPTPFQLDLFVLGALLFASLWKLLLGRGPLERLLGRAAEAFSSPRA